MRGVPTVAEVATWKTDARPNVVEYSPLVLDRIRLEAVTGLTRFRHGGVEIGGVLFGAHKGSTVRVLASRPVVSEYAHGPSYALSEKDEAGLERVIAGARSDPELRGLQPVGWYRSCTRTGIRLSGRDLELFDRYFPEDWQIALVLRPDAFGPAQAGFFFREADGSVRNDPADEEFLLEPLGPAAAAAHVSASFARPEAPQVEAQPATEPEPEPGPAPELPAQAAALSAYGEREERRERLWPWILAVLVLMAAGAAAFWWLGAQPAESVLALQAKEVDGQLRIAWDHDARSIREAASGVLEIVDGDQRIQIQFDAERLRGGSVVYARRTATVDVHLAVKDAQGRTTEELVRYVGQPVAAAESSGTPAREGALPEPPPPVAAAEPAAGESALTETVPPASETRDAPVRTDAAKRELEVAGRQSAPSTMPGPATRGENARELEALRRQPPTPATSGIAARSDAPGRELEAARQPVATPRTSGASEAAVRPRSSTETGQRTAPAARQPERPLPAFQPPPARRTAAATPSAPKPPAFGPAGSMPAHGPAIARTAERPLPAPPPASKPQEPVYAGPTRGRIIWTGRLRRGVPVTIDGRRASYGAINGELPGVPVRVSASPAEFTQQGLRVFTSNRSAAGANEPPGPGNGWNPTVYSLDVGRAGQVMVVDPPSSINRWKGLTLRGETDRVSAIIIDWRVAQGN